MLAALRRRGCGDSGRKEGYAFNCGITPLTHSSPRLTDRSLILLIKTFIDGLRRVVLVGSVLLFERD